MANKGPKPAAAIKPAAKATTVRAKRPATAAKRTVAKPKPKPVAAPREPVAPRPSPASPAFEAKEAAASAQAKPIATPAETIVAVAAEAAPTHIEDIETMQDTANKAAETVKANTAKAETLFVEFNDRAKTAMEKSSKMVEEMNDFAKGNVEAVVESSKIAAKGFETIGQDAAEYTRKSFEHATSAMKSFSAAKSPTDFFKLQSDYLRTAFDSMVAETSKNTEAMIKLAGDVAQPLSNRAAVAAEKIKVAA